MTTNVRYRMEAVNNNAETKMVAMFVNATKDFYQTGMEKPARVMQSCKVKITCSENFVKFLKKNLK